MNFLNKLEKKYRKYAIPNLMYYICLLYTSVPCLGGIHSSYDTNS